MYLKIPCYLLFSAVEQVYKASDKRHNMAILGNMKLVLNQNMLELTSSDLDVELSARLVLPSTAVVEAGQITVPAEKLYDIIKSLMPKDRKNRKNQDIELKLEKDYLRIYSGNSEFKLNTLPAEDFPLIGSIDNHQEIIIGDKDLKFIFDRTEFAIAVQDVRYYLMGMLFEFADQSLTTVATDGHRLAVASTAIHNVGADFQRSLIMPKKGVKELQRLLTRLVGDRDKYLKKVKKKTPAEANLPDSLKLILGNEFVQVMLPFYDYEDNLDDNSVPTLFWIQFTTKLIDGKFPDYRRIFPREHANIATINYEQLNHLLRRVSILSDEKTRGSMFTFEPNSNELTLECYSHDKDKAVATMPVQYAGQSLEISFNIGYLSAVLDAMADKNQVFDEIADDETEMRPETDKFDVIFKMNKANESVVIEKANEQQYRFLVMPIHM